MVLYRKEVNIVINFDTLMNELALIRKSNLAEGVCQLNVTKFGFNLYSPLHPLISDVMLVIMRSILLQSTSQYTAK